MQADSTSGGSGPGSQGNDEESAAGEKRWGFLPAIGTAKYHVLLAAVAILLLGPLGGITAAYMNFRLGTFVGGQVLAGILGSVVTYGYGPQGKHGANYMQTMAASVASMAAMGVLTQAMVWLGLPIPPAWQLIVYFMCIGMFGVGVGMMYTPMLVDRMQLAYPSGLAVANILRALTDKRLLKRSVGQLGAGTGAGFVASLAAEKVAAFSFLNKIGFSGSALGAGMIVGARIGVPAIIVGVIGQLMTPWLRQQGLLGPEDAFRKVGFLVALGTIMGAAIVDISIILYSAAKRLREKRPASAVPDAKGNMSTNRLFAWVAFWAVAVVVSGVVIMKVPVQYMLFAVALTFLFVMVNGISQGISDSNPISSAFVVSVLLMTVVGLADPGIGLLAGAVLLIATSVGCDMQQDRSTGWRLGSNRIIQFRYQVVGITMGAVCAVVITWLFMKAYPALSINTFANPGAADGWESTMTFKFVGALEGITKPNPTSTKLLMLGLGIGFVTEVLRKLIKNNAKYKAYRDGSKQGFVVDFVVDAVILPSPYASSYGGFVGFTTALWFGGGGVLGSSLNVAGDYMRKRKVEADKARGTPGEGDELPEDMSTVSLVGGGFIAGESLAALGIGIASLLAMFAD